MRDHDICGNWTTSSKAPISAAAIPSLLPSRTREFPVKSVSGSPGAELLPESTAGDEAVSCQSPNALTNKGSEEMFPFVPLMLEQRPPFGVPFKLKKSLLLNTGT